MGIANVNCHVQSCNLPYTFEDDVIYIIQRFNAENTKIFLKTYPGSFKILKILQFPCMS